LSIFCSLYILTDLDSYYNYKDFYKLLDKYKNNIKTILYSDYNRLINDYKREVINGYEVFKKFNHELYFVNEMVNVFDILKLNYDLNNYDIYVLGYDYKDVDLFEKNSILNNCNIVINDYNKSSEYEAKVDFIQYKNGIKRYYDLKEKINSGEVKDVIDEVSFCDNYVPFFQSDSIKGMDIIEIKTKAVIYKIIFEYIDNLYLNTGLYDVNNESDIGQIYIPKYTFNAHVYLSLESLFKDRMEHYSFNKVLSK
jgi:hypothetical protein